MELCYVMLEVGGIQSYICRTGKLKEMIGGSEIIESLSQDFYEGIRDSLGLNPKSSPLNDVHGVLELQRNAGTLCLAMQPDTAKTFLKAFSRAALERFPGLPLFGTSAPFVWTKDGLKEGRKAASNALSKQRGRVPVASGLLTLPVVAVARLDGLPTVDYDRAERISLPSRTRRDPKMLDKSSQRVAVARLDGLPTVDYDRDERISLPSRTRRDPKMLDKSSQRLQGIGQPFAEAHNLTLQWEVDLTTLLGGEKERMALIHMDGNDLGKLFIKELAVAAELDPLEGVRHLQELSNLVSRANTTAFREALEQVLIYELRMPKNAGVKALTVPLRPLVLGGDDITVIIRADLALPFIHHFVRTFERVTAEAKKPLSLGVGMVAMPATYPFVKAFSLVEDLLKSAKKATKEMPIRPSSLDYLVLTNDAETDLASLRRHTCTAVDGCSLTTKPFVLNPSALQNFCHDADRVLRQLPRSHTRPAMNACRQGKDAAQRDWKKLCENLHRDLGGRHGGKSMSVSEFERLFPDGFFKEQRTALGDYLELEHLLPTAPDARNSLLAMLIEPTETPEAPHA